MPCQYYSAGEERAETAKHMNLLTQDLCFLCGQLVARELLEEVASLRILKWWQNHQHDDTNRVVTRFEDLFQRDLNITPGEAATRFIAEAVQEHPVSDYHRAWFHRLAEDSHHKIRSRQTLKKKALSRLTYAERQALNLPSV